MGDQKDPRVAQEMDLAVDFIEGLLDGRYQLKGEVGRVADEMILEGASLGRMSQAQVRAAGRVGLGRRARRAQAITNGGRHG